MGTRQQLSETQNKKENLHSDWRKKCMGASLCSPEGGLRAGDESDGRRATGLSKGNEEVELRKRKLLELELREPHSENKYSTDRVIANC